MLTLQDMKKETLIDGDGHVLEPPDLWEKYISPKFRDRALMIRPSTEGGDHLIIDGKPSVQVGPPIMGALGGMVRWSQSPDKLKRANEMQRERMRKTLWPDDHGKAGSLVAMDVLNADQAPFTYLQGCTAGGMDMKERLKIMDEQGLEKAILYPTVGLCWEGEVYDFDLAAAYCEAYNRWIADFCRDSGGRLIPIAHISLADPDKAARELERAVKDGCKGAMVPPYVMSKKPHGHPDHHRVFAAAQDLDVPLGIHPAQEPPAVDLRAAFEGLDQVPWHQGISAPLAVPQAFATFFQYGVFDQFPKLRVVVLEAGAGWIGWFLDRADQLFNTIMGGSVPLKEVPSYYFKRQCYISADPPETTVAAVASIVGEDRFFWASDYPHPDRQGNFVEQLCTLVDGLSPAGRRKILSENVARAYRL